MVLVQEGLARNQEHPQQCGESLWPKRKIYRMAFGQYVSLFNAKAVAGQTGNCSTREVTIEIPIL
jgi:hypothetical protein